MLAQGGVVTGALAQGGVIAGALAQGRIVTGAGHKVRWYSKWQMANGNWQMANGKQQTANGRLGKMYRVVGGAYVC